jgi:hypothetical protein
MDPTANKTKDTLEQAAACLRTSRRMRIAAGLGSPFFLLFALALIDVIRAGKDENYGLLGLVLTIWITLPFMGVRVASQTASLLPSSVTAETLPIFLQALACASRRTREAAAEIIARSLGDLPREELTVLAREISLVSLALHACRKKKTGTMAAIALIEAVERLGDKRLSLPIEEMTHKPSNLWVQTAARRCLRTLETLAKRRVEEGHLLRPALPGDNASSLLRAVTTGQTPTEQLLRAETTPSPQE